MRLSGVRLVTYDDWQKWQRQGCTWLPAVAVRSDVERPASWEGFASEAPFALLESAQSGRYTYICSKAERLVWGERDGVRVFSGDGLREADVRKGTPLELLRELMGERRAPCLDGWPAMTGGFIGLFGYDLVQTWERLSPTAPRDLRLPLFAAIEPRELFIYDRTQRSLGVVVWSQFSPERSLETQFGASRDAAENAMQQWRSSLAHDRETRDGTSDARTRGRVVPTSSFSAEGFQAAAVRIHDYIAAGDTYQVNLSRRTSWCTTLPAEKIYEAVRRVNPSPYMGLFKLREFSLVCGSPELLVKLEAGVISSRPIAGTRPRGRVAADDSHFSAELLASEKERAEHLMLVDLIRNDIGRVAEFGSVHVPEFMVLERYSHVMHIVSQVEGRLASGCTWVDVFKSMFPGGTITGCPKVRTMEIIEELEPVGRGFYTGSLGWISYAGEMELNIVIRSMLLQDGIAHVQAGAGVVADSNPERELDEATRKAQALWVALERAEAASAIPSPA